jgi:tRNA-2-methylthio-N6-dimethylallyladenosine synthase
MPDMGMSTDIIVGFPGETEEEFEDTVKLCERTQYDMAYISQYSIRTGTPAWRLTDDVPREEKKRRDVVLTEILKKTARANAEKLVGTQRKVLIERINKRGWLSGKEEGFRTVTLPEVSDEDLIGTFIEVEIIAAHSFGVDGSLVGSK